MDLGASTAATAATSSSASLSSKNSPRLGAMLLRAFLADLRTERRVGAATGDFA